MAKKTLKDNFDNLIKKKDDEIKILTESKVELEKSLIKQTDENQTLNKNFIDIKNQLQKKCNDTREVFAKTFDNIVFEQIVGNNENEKKQLKEQIKKFISKVSRKEKKTGKLDNIISEGKTLLESLKNKCRNDTIV